MDNCPKCKSSWIGDKIPDDIAHNYYGTHWRREIGIDGGYLGVYDGIVAYRCSDCGEEFPRSNAPWALEMFEKYKELVNKNPHTGSSFDEFIEKEGLDINEKK